MGVRPRKASGNFEILSGIVFVIMFSKPCLLYSAPTGASEVTVNTVMYVRAVEALCGCYFRCYIASSITRYMSSV